MDQVANIGPQQLYDFLLNGRQLSEISILLSTIDGIAQPPNRDTLAQIFQFPIDEYVGSRMIGGGYSRDEFRKPFFIARDESLYN
jgi:hypothetical protein